MSTRTRDIVAWALIALAAEPYVVSVLGTYTPILLEHLARENGVLASDHLTPCLNKPIDDNPIPHPHHQITCQMGLVPVFYQF